jgi:mono/diheme cytochrome c family protein
MGIRLVNAVLALVLLGAIALMLMSRPNTATPNYEYLPEMAHSAAYKAFSPNPNFPDGKTQRAPVPGTIPRGDLPLRFQATPAEALRAGAELTNPFLATDTKAADRGALVFTNFCTPCHGASGRGDGLVAARGFPPPPSLLLEHAINMQDGQMFHVLSLGQGNMSPYASQVSREDRWKVILYVRWLQAEEQRKVKTEAALSAATPAAATVASPAVAAPLQPVGQAK